MYRAEYRFQFPTEDLTQPNPPVTLGEFFTEQPNIWRALDEARTKRHPIAQALLAAFPAELSYVKHEEIEIHLQAYDAQLGLFLPEQLTEHKGKAVRS